jgi:arabinofuranosyltransferase
MFIISFFNLIIPNIFYEAIIVSFVLSILTINRVYGHIKVNENVLLVLGFFILLLISSKSFIHYSSSGLENPLSFYLVTLFYTTLLSIEKLSAFTRKNFLFLFFVAALSFVNIRKRGVGHSFKDLFLATLPASLWLLFSLLYYGFLFPNTAYAKLNTGIETFKLIKQGINYFIDSRYNDPVVLPVLIFSILVSINSRKTTNILASFGIFLYLSYILIGGDFMVGRFFSVPFVLSTVLVINEITNQRIIILFSLIIIALIVINPLSPIKTITSDEMSDSYLSRNGITDEKVYYSPSSSLLAYDGRNSLPKHRWKRQAFENKEKVVVVSNIGYFGCFSKPDTFIINDMALSDPLLSRLPIPDKNNWRIGHFIRTIPEGYVESIKTGNNLIKQPDLHIFYEKLRKITRGSVFNLKRFKEIFLMNIRTYDYHLTAYINKK